MNRSNQRPDTLMQDRKPDRRTLLRRTAGPYIGVICDGFPMSATRLFYPTIADQGVKSGPSTHGENVTAGLRLEPDGPARHRNRRDVPCVDGSALARTFFTSQVWSEQPCVRPVDAVHMTAGHNALRGSGPGQKPAFDNAVAHVGCPDLRIDRICITCCSSFQPSHHAG